MRTRPRLLSLGVASALLLASPAAAAGSSYPVKPGAIAWEPVHTILAHGPGDFVSVTTDNGLVVAAWTGRSFDNVWIATRRSGEAWGPATRLAASAGALDIAKAGKGAWLMWQGFNDVEVVPIGSNGAVGAPLNIGSSTDPFIAEPHIAVGGNGAVAATWRTTDSAPAQLAYRTSGGSWSSEGVPLMGGVVGVVVGSAGTAQLVVSTGSDFRHQQLNYLRRTAGGDWRTPVVVATGTASATVAGDPDGDIVVGWEEDNGSDGYSLVARYKAADAASFDVGHHFDDGAPYGSYVALGMAANGSLAAAYRVTDQGASQIAMTPADSSGTWLADQLLAMTGGRYGVAMNAAGAFVVSSQSNLQGVQLVRCTSSDVCGDEETNPATGFKFPSTTLGPNGAVNLVWGRGCKGEGCYPTSVVAQRGH